MKSQEVNGGHLITPEPIVLTIYKKRLEKTGRNQMIRDFVYHSKTLRITLKMTHSQRKIVSRSDIFRFTFQ